MLATSFKLLAKSNENEIQLNKERFLRKTTSLVYIKLLR